MRAPTCVLGVLCFSLQGDHHTNPSSATLLTIFLRHVLTSPSDSQDSPPRCFLLGARRSFSPPSLLQEHRPWSENDESSFLEREGLLLVGFLTRSVQRSRFRPGSRRSFSCCLYLRRSSGRLRCRTDGVVVLERVGLLLVAFQKRSDTDMLWSACFELKTKVTEAHTSKRSILWRAAWHMKQPLLET